MNITANNSFFNSGNNFDVEKMLSSEKNLKPFVELEKKMKRYRFMIYLQSISDLPQDLDMKKNYFIESTFFDQKIKMKLDLTMLQQKGKQIFLPINKIKVFYFFACNNKSVNEFFREEQVKK